MIEKADFIADNSVFESEADESSEVSSHRTGATSSSGGNKEDDVRVIDLEEEEEAANSKSETATEDGSSSISVISEEPVGFADIIVRIPCLDVTFSLVLPAAEQSCLVEASCLLSSS